MPGELAPDEREEKSLNRERNITIAIGVILLVLVVCAIFTVVALALLGPAIGNIFSNIVVPE